MRRFLASLLLLILWNTAGAGETPAVYRGARAQAMGNAYSAIADDDMAVYLNPAGLAGNTSTKLHLFDANFTGSSDIISAATESASAFGKLSGETLNILMGKNITATGQATSTLMFPGFAISGLLDRRLGLHQQNKAYPQTLLTYQSTNGVQVAYGTRIGRSSGKGKNKDEYRVGFGAKMMFRRGGTLKLTPLELIQANKEDINSRVGDYGRGFGFDIGTQYIRHVSQNLSLSAAFTVLDFGDTNYGAGPDPQKQNVTIGGAVTYDMGALRGIFAYDYKNLMDQTDWRKKNHIGVELKLPIFSLYAGVNQVYFSYGAGVDFWLIRVTAASYTEEQGSFAFQNPEHRYMVRVGITFQM